MLQGRLDSTTTKGVMATFGARLEAIMEDYNILKGRLDGTTTMGVMATFGAPLEALMKDLRYSILQQQLDCSKTRSTNEMIYEGNNVQRE
jgi:hypothetical protein